MLCIDYSPYSESASCTHVAALLHALCGLTPSTFSLGLQGEQATDEEFVPITSQLCKWNVHRKRKSSTLPIATVEFEKHDYSKQVKRKVKSLEDFDPRPPEFRGTATRRLPELLRSIRGQQLCFSLLFDETCQHRSESETGLSTHTSSCNIPDVSNLRKTIAFFKESLHLTDDHIQSIEQKTRDQRLSPLWHSERRFRITASYFGSVLLRKESTPPDNLVISLLQLKKFTTAATQYGINTESTAIAAYTLYQHEHGHPDLTVSPSGFIVCSTHPFLGASPDGAVYDPSSIRHPFGFLEIKCPFMARNISPQEAGTNPRFCCTTDQNGHLLLKESHAYYAQVQGQMAVVVVHGVILLYTQAREF